MCKHRDVHDKHKGSLILRIDEQLNYWWMHARSSMHTVEFQVSGLFT